MGTRRQSHQLCGRCTDGAHRTNNRRDAARIFRHQHIWSRALDHALLAALQSPEIRANCQCIDPRDDRSLSRIFRLCRVKERARFTHPQCCARRHSHRRQSLRHQPRVHRNTNAAPELQREDDSSVARTRARSRRAHDRRLSQRKTRCGSRQVHSSSKPLAASMHGAVDFSITLALGNCLTLV